MPVATPSLLDAISATNVSGTLTSNSVSPTGNGLLFISAHYASAATGTKLPLNLATTLSGVTFTKVGEDEFDDGNATITVGLWRVVVGGSPGSGTITVATNQGTCNRRTLQVFEVPSGFNASAPIKQAKAGNFSGNPFVLTYDDALDGDSLALAVVGMRGTTTLTKDNDYTQLNQTSAGSGQCAQIQYVSPAPDTTVQWGSNQSRVWAGIAIEIDAAAAGLSGSVNQVSETDAAQAIARVKQKAAGQSLETDAAQAVAPARVYALEQTSEADSAQPVTSAKYYPVGQVTEADEAQAITPRKVVVVNQASETDTAQDVRLPGAITVQVGQVAETDSAQPIAARKVYVISQVAETDLAQGLFPQKRVSVAQVVETDTAQQIRLLAGIVIPVGQAVEIDTALSIRRIGPGGVSVIRAERIGTIPADGIEAIRAEKIDAL